MNILYNYNIIKYFLSTLQILKSVLILFPLIRLFISTSFRHVALADI